MYLLAFLPQLPLILFFFLAWSNYFAFVALFCSVSIVFILLVFCFSDLTVFYFSFFMQFLCSFYSLCVHVFFFGVLFVNFTLYLWGLLFAFAFCLIWSAIRSFCFLIFFFLFLFWVFPCCWFCAFVLGRIFDIFVLLTNLRRTMQTNTVYSPAHRYKCICNSSVVSFFFIFIIIVSFFLCVGGRGDKWLAAFQYGANWVFNCLTFHLLTSFFARNIFASERSASNWSWDFQEIFTFECRV